LPVYYLIGLSEPVAAISAISLSSAIVFLPCPVADTRPYRIFASFRSSFFSLSPLLSFVTRLLNSSLIAVSTSVCTNPGSANGVPLRRKVLRPMTKNGMLKRSDAAYGTTSRGREEKEKMFCLSVCVTFVGVDHQFRVYITLSVMFCNASLILASLKSRSNSCRTKYEAGSILELSLLNPVSAMMV
jgi:hypothetical protein